MRSSSLHSSRAFAGSGWRPGGGFQRARVWFWPWAPDWHRRSGITATVPAAGAAWIAHRLAEAATPGGRWLRRSAFGSPPTALFAAVHPGALMVWGQDYFDASE